MTFRELRAELARQAKAPLTLPEKFIVAGGLLAFVVMIVARLVQAL